MVLGALKCKGDGKGKGEGACFNCFGTGHYAIDCPNQTHETALHALKGNGKGYGIKGHGECEGNVECYNLQIRPATSAKTAGARVKATAKAMDAKAKGPRQYTRKTVGTVAKMHPSTKPICGLSAESNFKAESTSTSANAAQPRPSAGNGVATMLNEIGEGDVINDVAFDEQLGIESAGPKHYNEAPPQAVATHTRSRNASRNGVRQAGIH